MIILDTSFIVSYYNDRDDNHTKAVELMKEIVSKKYGNLYISDYIFDESINVMLVRSKSLSKTIEIGELIKKSTEILDVEKDIFEEAWELFKKQKESKFSFTDCTTIAVMMERDIGNIATFDEEFKKIKGINAVEI